MLPWDVTKLCAHGEKLATVMKKKKKNMSCHKEEEEEEKHKLSPLLKTTRHRKSRSMAEAGETPLSYFWR